MRSDLSRFLGAESRADDPRGVLPLRLIEDPESLVLEANLPGIDPETVEVTTLGDTLTLRGERPAEEHDDARRTHRRERWNGRFARSVTLPGGFESENVSASYTNGVLRVHLPRREKAAPKKIEIRTA